MKQNTFTIEYNRRLTKDVWELVLSGDTAGITAPGQFVNIAVEGHYLRRPVSVCNWTEGGLLLLIKEAGEGTRKLVRLPVGTQLDVLTGLGNGFDLNRTGEAPILAGGGIGAAPLYGLAKALLRKGVQPAIALGFPTADGAVYLEEFASLGCPLAVATVDGTLGAQGPVTVLLRSRQDRDYVFCCGPAPMLQAVHEMDAFPGGQYSFEARMGCGFGACMGCSVPTASGMKRVCRDGPVFFREEIVWQA